MTVHNQKKTNMILTVLLLPSLMTVIAAAGYNMHRSLAYELCYSTPVGKSTDVIFNAIYGVFAIAFLMSAYWLTVIKMREFFEARICNPFLFPLGLLLSIFPSWLIEYLIYVKMDIMSYPWEPSYAMTWIGAIFYALPFALIGIIKSFTITINHRNT